MVRLTHQQRSFVVTEYARLGSLALVRAAFANRYPGRRAPARSTILRNYAKYHVEGTSLNLNKGRIGRRRIVRTEENVQAVRNRLQDDNQPAPSARRNGLEMAKSSFNWITRLDIRWHPYKMHV